MRVLTGVLSVALAACLVGACGGGGGSGPTVSTDPAPTADTRAFTAQFQSLHGRSDALLTTDFHWVDPGPTPHSYPLGFRGIYGSCRGSVCTGVMPSHLPDIPVHLSDLEAADEYEIFGSRNGVTLTNGASEEIDETGAAYGFSLEGWLDHNVFGLSRVYFHSPTDGPLGSLDGAYSFGDSTGSAPVRGSAVWDGAMLGTEAGELYIVQGDARVRVEFATMAASVAFTNIFNRGKGTSLPSMRWSELTIDSGGRFVSLRGRPPSWASVIA